MKCLVDNLENDYSPPQRLGCMRYEAAFNHLAFPRNLKEREGKHPWRGDLQGLLILVSLALFDVNTVELKKAEGPIEQLELVPFLTALGDDEHWVEGVQKLSVLLLGMGLSPVC